MSPPTVVLNRDQVDIPRKCPVVEIVQYECALYEGQKEYTCQPLARRFRVCETALGSQRYEITDEAMSSEILDATREMLSLTRGGS